MTHPIDCSCQTCNGDVPTDGRFVDGEKYTRRVQVMLKPSQYLKFLEDAGTKDLSVHGRDIILEKLGLTEVPK